MSGIIGGAGSRSGILGTFKDLTVLGDVDLQDDKGLILGSGDDFWLGLNAGETGLAQYAGGTQGQDPDTEGVIVQNVSTGSNNTEVYYLSGDGRDLDIYLRADRGDDNFTNWAFKFATNGWYYINSNYNTLGQNFVFYGDGHADADLTWNDNQWDYAELFEWKTHLATDDAVKELYGMSVVLEDGKVRVAEAGDEDNILGVVRAKGSTATHGDGLQWNGKYIKTVWGEFEMENYIQVVWNEYLPNGNISYRHQYMKDEIPFYRLQEDIGRDKDSHLKESNYLLDKEGEKIPVIAPSTDEEKTLARYSERNHEKGDSNNLLMRRKYVQNYDQSIGYIKRTDRPKEWVLIGLLGQVPVNTSTIIPSHWKKFYNLESGVDKYYIYNK